MIELCSPPELKPDPMGGWELILWVGDAFNYTTPFREMLHEIAEQLGQDPQKDLRLPKHEEQEDFVEGTLRFGNDFVQTYFEHSLSYLALMSDSETTLRNLADRLKFSDKVN
jgi:hypothetical protein